MERPPPALLNADEAGTSDGQLRLATGK